jgi:hypothetical protein
MYTGKSIFHVAPHVPLGWADDKPVLKNFKMRTVGSGVDACRGLQ